MRRKKKPQSNTAQKRHESRLEEKMYSENGREGSKRDLHMKTYDSGDQKRKNSKQIKEYTEKMTGKSK